MESSSEPPSEPFPHSFRLSLIRWTILLVASATFWGYSRLLPSVLNNLLIDLPLYGTFLIRFAFAVMFFLQVVYIFGVDPRLAGRERGPKGDRVYLLGYFFISLLPFLSTLLIAYFQQALLQLNQFCCPLVILYLVMILPTIILLELLVKWRSMVQLSK